MESCVRHLTQAHLPIGSRQPSGTQTALTLLAPAQTPAGTPQDPFLSPAFIPEILGGGGLQYLIPGHLSLDLQLLNPVC